MRHGSDKSRMGLVVIIAHNPYVAKLPDSDYNLQILSWHNGTAEIYG